MTYGDPEEFYANPDNFKPGKRVTPKKLADKDLAAVLQAHLTRCQQTLHMVLDELNPQHRQQVMVAIMKKNRKDPVKYASKEELDLDVDE